MSGTEARIGLFAGDAPAARFADAAWRARRVAVDGAALRGAIDALDPARCRRVVLAGSFAHEHGALAELIDAARARAIRAVAVETDAADLAPQGRAAALAARGVSDAVLWVGGVRERVHEAVMRDPGGWRGAAEGLRAAIGAGLRTYVVLPLVEWSEGDAVPLAEWLAALPARPAGLLLAVPRVEVVPEHAHDVLRTDARVAGIAARVFDACRRGGLEWGFASAGDAPLPCASRALDPWGTVFHGLVRHRQREAADGATFERVAACAECSLRDTCPGVPPAHATLLGADALRPVPLEASMGWVLRRANRLEEHDYRNVSAFDAPVDGEGRSLLRINGHCPMSCAFCFVDRTVGDFETDALRGEIDALAARHTDHLVLSGGEPTIHPDLAVLIAHARTRGYRTIEIQTNGVRCEDEVYARTLVDAGLTKATVSLHSPDAATSDEITRMKGAFPRTVAGLRTLRRLGVHTQIAHVITKKNFEALPAFVRFVRDAFPPEDAHLSICFAIAQGMSDLVYSWVIPTFTEIRPFVREALDLCDEAGIGYGGLIGQGGYPPCQLDGELRYYRGNFGRIYRSADYAEQFHKAERCRTCSFDPFCVGVRRDYVQTYGDAEIRPFEAEPGALSGLAPLGQSRPLAAGEGHMPRTLVSIRKKRAAPAPGA